MTKIYVEYEDFGAVGDGRTDDLPSIVKAHEYANLHGLPVLSRPNATYYIGAGQETAIIKTPTDWGTSRFIIDDTDVENYTADVFAVMPSGEWTSLDLPPLSHGQTCVDVKPACDMYVTVVSDERRQYIRYGGNRDSGSNQTDSFILTSNGEILSGINWDYTRITDCRAIPIDKDELTVKGGFFTTVANQAESKYTYFARGISVRRSNTVIDNVSHMVTGEGEHGAPYNGFFSFSHCAYIKMQNCHVCGHKIYNTIGSAGVTVPMGSYDINCYAVIDISFINVRQDDIINRSLWGVFGSNFCKKMLFDGCVLSRSDAHCGLRDYTVRNSVIGWMGTNTIGFGEMLLENVTCFGDNVVGFRDDYGCTWDGNLTLRNIVWIPRPGQSFAPTMLRISNKGRHDFGYKCTLPHNILIENVTVVDTNLPDNCDGIRIFDNFNPEINMQNRDTYKEPYPLERPLTVTIKNLKTISGKKPIICGNMALFTNTKFEIID